MKVIVINGPMGVGKTTIGKYISEKIREPHLLMMTGINRPNVLIVSDRNSIHSTRFLKILRVNFENLFVSVL